ncbi:MAG TPA: L,D-transpeptidase [Nitrospirota bacterium]|nr:L,D-transpeptidase [Nitrospirota bacterium]
MQTAKKVIEIVLLLAFSFAAPSLAGALDAVAPDTTDELRAQVHAMEQDEAALEEENQGLRKMLKQIDDNEIYLVVDTESNRLTMRRGRKTLMTAVVGTGSRQFVQEETGRSWYFESPTGALKVLGKERNPVWIRPDWSYAEENMPVPPENDPDRIVRGVLGKYALILGNGYKIHGTKYTDLLGTHFTHGCISVGDKDLETLYRSVKIGTKVYIY